MEWLLENSDSVVAIAAAAGVLGGLIVKLTPTQTDDKWWQAITGLLRRR